MFIHTVRTRTEQAEYMTIIGQYPHCVSIDTDNKRNQLMNELWDRSKAAKQSSNNNIASLKAKLAATQNRLAVLKAKLEQVPS